MSSVLSEGSETRMVLENVSWETFEALAGERRGSVPRMTYNEGVLEMMSPKRKHENLGCLIGRMIEAYSEVKGIRNLECCFGNCETQRSEKSYEADESYYVTNIDKVLTKRNLTSK